MNQSNCRNCGAPVDESGKCAYCGTIEKREIESYMHISADGIRIGAVVVDRMKDRYNAISKAY